MSRFASRVLLQALRFGSVCLVSVTSGSWGSGRVGPWLPPVVAPGVRWPEGPQSPRLPSEAPRASVPPLGPGLPPEVAPGVRDDGPGPVTLRYHCKRQARSAPALPRAHACTRALSLVRPAASALGPCDITVLVHRESLTTTVCWYPPPGDPFSLFIEDDPQNIE